MNILSIKQRVALAIYRILKKVEAVGVQCETDRIINQFATVGRNCHFRNNDYNYIGGAQYIKIGDNFSVGRSLRMEAIYEHYLYKYNPELVIGDNVWIEDYCHIGCANKIVIGNGVLIASKVYISDHNHGEISGNDLKLGPLERPLSTKPIVIGNNVWIGEGVCIMPGVELGDNIIIGANSVVTHSFPANVVIAGCPAKVIRELL